MKILMVIAPERYQDIEYEHPKAVFEKAGLEVVTTSTVHEPTGKLGGMTRADLLLEGVKVADYAAVVFIGGPGVFSYFENPTVLNLARDFYKAGKPTCAICAAPGILANAGLLVDKTMTCWPGEAEHVQAKGARYTGKPVECDGLIITGSGPEAAEAFGHTVVAALNE